MKKNYMILAFGVLSAVILIANYGADAGPKTKLDAPSVTTLATTQVTGFKKICAGTSGASAGFSLQWAELPVSVSCDEYVWPTDSVEGNVCKGSFSGVPGCSFYNLSANACVVTEIGNLNDAECGVGFSGCGAEELRCGTTYVTRGFAHNEPGKRGFGRSEFTANSCFTTLPCREICVRSQGYWKNNKTEWPVDFLAIGLNEYTKEDLLQNLNLPGQGNAVRILSHQLIAAKLNFLAGASAGAVLEGQTISDVVGAADALIGRLDINSDSVATSSSLGQQMTGAARLLDLYNTGFGGVNHCGS